MAPPRRIEFSEGKVTGRKFIFDNAGDELAEHTHAPSENHMSTVAKGTFLLLGQHSLAGEERSEGAVIFWIAGEPHGYRAMTDGAVIVNHDTGK